MANIDHHAGCDHSVPKMKWFKCPKWDCNQRRRSMAAGMCPVHRNLVMKPVK